MFSGGIVTAVIVVNQTVKLIMNPTKEQWFWEQCGGVYVAYDETDGCPAHFVMPNGDYISGDGCIDLNRLLRYAVPKTENYHLGSSVYGHTAIVWRHGTTFKGVDKDPALALYEAIYKALGGKG